MDKLAAFIVVVIAYGIAAAVGACWTTFWVVKTLRWAGVL